MFRNQMIHISDNTETNQSPIFLNQQIYLHTQKHCPEDRYPLKPKENNNNSQERLGCPPVPPCADEVISELRTLSPKTKVVLTGYSVPSGPLSWQPAQACSEIMALEPLNEAVMLGGWSWWGFVW